PLDTNTIYTSIKKNGRCLVVTEETINNSFAQTLAGRIQENCFEYLDAPVRTIGSKNLPAIPLNSILEQEMVLNAEKVRIEIESVLKY
ncbi:MAG: transketolase C-terminal domain-containing protein, partial [Saprospiraceae bacterium]